MASLSKENNNPEEKLLFTLDDLDIGFVKVSENGIILNHNLTLNNIFGINLETNLVGTKFLDCWLNLEEQNKFREILYKNGIVKKFMASIKKVDGEKIFLELTFKLNKNSNGEIISSEGTFIDVSERIENEIKLKESEERFRRIIENAPVGYYRVGKNGLWQYVNPVWEKMHNYSLQEIIGKSFEITQPESAKEQARINVQRVLSGESMTGEFGRTKKDGTVEYHTFNIQPIYQKDKIIAIEGFINDITESKQMEQKLKESEIELRNLNTKLEQKVEERTKKLKESEEKYKNLSNEFEMILDNIPALVFYKDTENRFIHVNKSLADGYKMKKEELTGKSLFELYPEEEAQTFLDDDLEVIKSGKPKLNYEEHWQAADGLRWVLTSKIPYIDEDRNIKGIIGFSSDITERKQAEQKLKESEEKYRKISYQYEMLLESITDGVYVLDKNWEYVMINKNGADLVQMPVDQLIGNKLTVLFPGIEQTQFFKSYNEVMNKRKTERVMSEFTYPDGRRGYYEVSIYPVNEGILCIARDTSEEKIAEQKLKESEEKYRKISYQYEMLLESITDGVYVLDKNWEYVMINKNGADLVQMPVDQLIGNKLTVLFPGIEQTQFFKSYNEVMNKRKTERVMSEFTYPDGRRGYYEVSIYPVNEGILCIARDTSEEKIAEQKLKESEEKFAKVFHSSPNLLAITKMENGEIVNVNEGFLLTLGYTREEVIGKSTFDLNLWVDLDERNSFLKALKEKKRVKELEVQTRTKSGQILTTLFSGEITRLDNELHLITIATDITEHKKSEKKLEELGVMKSEFLRRASHELKTPLISIKGFSELILSLYADQLDPPIISKIREINDGCERLLNIINNILKTSQLESPEIRPSKKKEDLSFLIKFCVNELESLAKRRNQSIKLDIHREIYVNIEKEEIHDVLSNLLSNAIKYTPTTGKIEIKTELKKDSVVVSVNDNGIGFTEDQKKKIFQQFGKIERYGQGLDLEIGGTGLGLYISKKIVEAHGGKIWMESEGKNKGSSFYFALPTVK